jgi:hypothetical protein
MRSLIDSICPTLILVVGLTGQTPRPPTALSLTDHAIGSLRQVSLELNDAVKSFYTHLDKTIARHDRGYRSKSGLLVQAADVDLNSGPAYVVWAATRKFASFRMLAARNEEYDPVVLADVDRIEQLVLETRKQVDASVTKSRRLLIVSVTELDPHQDAI